MKAIREVLTGLLAICLSFNMVPAFAAVSSAQDMVKVELTDSELASAVGAGAVDATMADYAGGGATAKAVIANRSTLVCDYTLSVVNASGGVLEVLASGSINPDTAMLVSGTPVSTPGQVVQIHITNAGVPGLEARDTYWAN